MSASSEHTQKPLGGTVSLRDVAAAVGVSRMTVSRAFKPHAPVNAQLRAKILETAEKMGYVPDAMVSELMTSFANRRPVQYHETIAALWWPVRWSNLKTRSDFDAEIYRGLNEGAHMHGRHVDHLVLSEDLHPQALDRMLRARGIQGVILTPPLPAHTPPPALDWTRLSATVIGSSLEQSGLNRAQANHHQGIVLALNELAARGYRRPCLLVRTDLEERMQRVYSGAFLAWGNPESLIWRQSSPDVPGLNEWLEQVAPDVIIGDCDRWMACVSPKLLGCGYVSLDVRDSGGRIAGIYQNTARIAMAAVDLLVRARLMHETGILDVPLVLLTSGVWRDADSLQRKKREVTAVARSLTSELVPVPKKAGVAGGGGTAKQTGLPKVTKPAERTKAAKQNVRSKKSKPAQ